MEDLSLVVLEADEDQKPLQSRAHLRKKVVGDGEDAVPTVLELLVPH